MHARTLMLPAPLPYRYDDITPHFTITHTVLYCTPHPPIQIKMTIKASQFTPQVLLSAPRRSAGVPNANGSYVLFTVNSV
jgi:hypothetical protein